MMWIGSGSSSQGWQGFGGGVWWFRSPPARGASVSGGGPDHELPHPPRATATNPLSPLHHQHRHPSNPKPTGRQRFTGAAAAAAAYGGQRVKPLEPKLCFNRGQEGVYEQTITGLIVQPQQ
ncbi:unnamed protein product [Pleuronectes platessa]|uniref:Uncharacterized protein n=1 Tax=Pleuronectes platessa TaxID=8262 RepID=A0A9N7VQI0_PLEPL|nr:unnamed protein product [Pleuronectes platessa]